MPLLFSRNESHFSGKLYMRPTEHLYSIGKFCSKAALCFFIFFMVSAAVFVQSITGKFCLVLHRNTIALCAKISRTKIDVSIASISIVLNNTGLTTATRSVDSILTF